MFSYVFVCLLHSEYINVMCVLSAVKCILSQIMVLSYVTT